jgi:hypothetical protein
MSWLLPLYFYWIPKVHFDFISHKNPLEAVARSFIIFYREFTPILDSFFELVDRKISRRQHAAKNLCDIQPGMLVPSPAHWMTATVLHEKINVRRRRTCATCICLILFTITLQPSYSKCASALFVNDCSLTA